MLTDKIIQIIFWRLAVNYDKVKIENLYHEYVATEDLQIFEKLIIALMPMVTVVVKRYYQLSHLWQDMEQEILMALWKNQRNLKKLRSHQEYPVNYMFYMCRGHAAKVSVKIGQIYNDRMFNSWITHDPWMGNLEFDQGTKMFERGS